MTAEFSSSADTPKSEAREGGGKRVTEGMGGSSPGDKEGDKLAKEGDKLAHGICTDPRVGGGVSV